MLGRGWDGGSEAGEIWEGGKDEDTKWRCMMRYDLRYPTCTNNLIEEGFNTKY